MKRILLAATTSLLLAGSGMPAVARLLAARRVCNLPTLLRGQPAPLVQVLGPLDHSQVADRGVDALVSPAPGMGFV